MKRNTLLILSTALVLVFTAMACGDDDATPDGFIEFRHDDVNVDAPIFDAGFYESAARFTNTYPGNDDGSELTEIEYYIKNVPASASIKVYAGGIITPEELVYEADITNELSTDVWITHTLTSPLVLDGRDLWIAIRYNQTTEQRVIGCDGGPADSNGDWFYDDNTGQWDALVNLTGGGVNINWNIRGLVKTAE